MATIFKDNQYPQVMFKAEGPTLMVNSVNEYKAALADGWSPTHIPQEFPRWVKTGEKRPDGKPIKVLCQNAEEVAAAKTEKPLKPSVKAS